MLTTYMRHMCNNNLEIMIAGSSCCPQLTWSMIMSNFFDIYQYFSWILLNSLLSLFSCWLTIFLSHHCIFCWIRISKLQDQLYSLSTARSYKKLVLDRLVLWICDCLNKLKMKSYSNFFPAFTLLLQYCLTLPLLNVVNTCCLLSSVTYCYVIIINENHLVKFHA